MSVVDPIGHLWGFAGVPLSCEQRLALPMGLDGPFLSHLDAVACEMAYVHIHAWVRIFQILYTRVVYIDTKL